MLILVAGIGLLKRRGWGRGLSLTWAVIAIVMNAASLAVNAVSGRIQPLGFVTTALLLAYPIVVLAVLAPGRRKAFFDVARMPPPGAAPPSGPPY